MARINVEIPEKYHRKLRKEKAIENVTIKFLVQEAIKQRYEDQETKKESK